MPTRQDGVENRDKVYLAVLITIIVIIKKNRKEKTITLRQIELRPFTMPGRISALKLDHEIQFYYGVETTTFKESKVISIAQPTD